ncbi:MAG: DUF5688 family protein [bacterium]|nr:DUF5688 family protein [bacterium]MCM1500491.1 DUF5688 family protein [Clostridium sp.]
MEMNDFAQRTRSAVEEKLGGGYGIEVREVRKNNGLLLHGLAIWEQGSQVVPTVYLENYLEAYEAGIPFERLVKWILCEYTEKKPEGNPDMEYFRHFGAVKDRICYRLVNREKNKALLEERPHLDFLDLAICFYYDYRDRKLGKGTIPIIHSHVEEWGTNSSELFRLAQTNTPRLFPWECRGMEDILKSMEAGPSEDGREDSYGRGNLVDIPMKVLTNASRCFGAACILYPGVLGQVAEKEGKNLFILPSSIHETILLPDDGGDTDGLKNIISCVNRTTVAPEDVLSDSLYYYDRSEKEIRVL